MKYFIGLLLLVFLVFGCDRLSEGEHFATINGNSIQYFVYGKGPILLFPSQGQGFNVDYYIKNLKLLQNYFKIVFYNTRGTGKSTGPTDITKYGSDEYLSDMDELRKYLFQDKVWLIGHSGGGYQILNFAASFPKNVNGVIALSTIISVDDLQTREQLRNIKKWSHIPNYTERYNAFFRTNTVENIESDLNLITPFYFYDYNNYLKFANKDVKINKFVFQASFSSRFARKKILYSLRKIQAPTLLLVGDNDLICDEFSQSRRAHKEIKSSLLVTILNSGHLPWLENKEHFEKELIKWINNNVKKT